MIGLETYTPSGSLPAKVKRRLTQWRASKPLAIQPKTPIVSFTFDDFPKTAAQAGADIIEKVGGRATYYACSGMAGTKTVTGEQYTSAELVDLLSRGHEIGAHTHTHLDCAKARVPDAVSNIHTNLSQLRDMGADHITQFAYPYGETQTALKDALKGTFETARGVLAGTNGRGSDLMQLRALELTPDDRTTDRAAAAIRASAGRPSWVVIFTHDVHDEPSDYGTRPESLSQLANLARDTGASILSIGDALKVLCGDQS